MRITLIAIFQLLCNSLNAQPIPEARLLYNKMMASIDKVKTATFTMELNERIYDKLVYGKQQVKLNVKPYKVYIYSVTPDPGAEVLFVEGENNGRALINPNKFPFFNVNLTPGNSLFRKNHQYTAEQVGFGYLYSILRSYEFREKDNFFGKLSVKKDTLIGQTNYQVLEIDNDNFGFINYKVMKDENVTDIARKFFVNDQMILDLNRDIKYFDDVTPGQVITIPNSFARKIVFFIDYKTGLPLLQFVYDNKGLYSKVAFSNFALNPAISSEEFSRSYTHYKF